MKAFFLALLLGNLLFFAWSRWHAPAGSQTAAAAREVPPTLALAPTVSAKAEQAADGTRCLSVGPFHDLPGASEASVSLRELGYGPHTRVDEGDVWGGLWVYLEDLPSRAEAQRVMNILKQNGMNDAYVMPGAEQSINISLGIFSEAPRAQRRAAEVRRLGFIPTVAERTRKGTVYWLDVDIKPGGVAINPADLRRKDANGSGTIVRLEIKPCPVPAAQTSG